MSFVLVKQSQNFMLWRDTFFKTCRLLFVCNDFQINGIIPRGLSSKLPFPTISSQQNGKSTGPLQVKKTRELQQVKETRENSNKCGKNEEKVTFFPFKEKLESLLKILIENRTIPNSIVIFNAKTLIFVCIVSILNVWRIWKDFEESMIKMEKLELSMAQRVLSYHYTFVWLKESHFSE